MWGSWFFGAFSVRFCAQHIRSILQMLGFFWFIFCFNLKSIGALMWDRIYYFKPQLVRVMHSSCVCLDGIFDRSIFSNPRKRRNVNCVWNEERKYWFRYLKKTQRLQFEATAHRIQNDFLTTPSYKHLLSIFYLVLCVIFISLDIILYVRSHSAYVLCALFVPFFVSWYFFLENFVWILFKVFFCLKSIGVLTRFFFLNHSEH